MKRILKKANLIFLAFTFIFAQLVIFLPKIQVAQAAQAAKETQSEVQSEDTGIAQKPYMGWSSYSMQVYSGNGQWITADQIKAQSDAMHQKLQSHGYEYINIDAGWPGSQDNYGRPVPSTTLFPNGLQEVIDYIHKNGQKVGLYTIPGLSREAYTANLPIYGTTDCHMQDIAQQPLHGIDYWGYTLKIDFSKPCAQKYIDSMADLYAEWGIDFLKFDSVTPGSGHNDLSLDARGDVKAWSEALAPHHIWFELSWALDHNYAEYWKKYANGWRVDWDIECYCGNQALTTWANITRLFPDANLWWRDAGPGGWNDFDSLNIGNGAMDGLTMDERKAAMTLYAISSAQLYVGNDMTKLDDYGIELLTNDEVIAVNQAGHPGHPVSMATDQQVWYANNGDGTYSVALFNLGSTPATVTVNWNDIGLSGSASVRDLWSHKDLGTFDTGYSSVDLAPHASRLFKVVSKGGTSAVNDDERISYSGTWTRNGGRELAQPAQNLVVNVNDSSTMDSTISPLTAHFDKNVAKQADVATTMTLNSNTLTGIKNGNTSLVQSQDYTVTGDQVVIKKQYLANLPVGTSYLTFSFNAGAAQTLIVSVSDTTLKDSTISTTSVSYDKNPAKQADPSVTLTLNGNILRSVANGGTPLNPNTAYKISGDKLILKQEYLAGLPNGMTKLTLTFSYGASLTVDVAITDTSKGASHSLNDTDAGIVYTGSWGYSNGRNLGDYMNDVHYTEANGNSLSYTFTGTGIEYLTEKDPSQGDIDFYVDGVYKQTVSTYDIARSGEQLIYSIAGLDYGTHTLKAVKKTGVFMLLDKLRVILPDLISPDVGSFDKKATTQAEVTVATSVYGSVYGLKGIADGGSALVADTHYTTAGNQITLKKEYLAAQPLGTSNLTFTFNSGATQNLSIAIKDSSVTNSTIGTTSVSFDKKSTEQADAAVPMELNGNVLVGIAGDGKALTQGTDYAVSGSKVIINKGYLATLPVGTTNLVFTFSVGAAQTLAVSVSDTTPTFSPSAVSFDRKPTEQADLSTTVALHGDVVSGIANGGAALAAGKDYSVSGSGIFLKKEYMSTLPIGVTNLTVNFASGATQTLPVVVFESSRGRVVTLNDDAPGIMFTGNWNRSTGRNLGDYMNDVHWTETGHDYYEYTFTGTGIEVVTEKDSSQGDIDFYIDGELKQTISTYSSSKQSQQTVYAISGLPFGAHTLKAVKRTGYYMLLDGFRIILPDLISPDAVSFNKKAPTDLTISMTLDGSNLSAISNNGITLVKDTNYTVAGNKVTIKKEYLASQPVGTTYLSFSFRGNYQDDVHATEMNNDSFTYEFRGTGIDLISDKSPEQGDMDIYVDNKFVQTVSAYNAVRITQQTLFNISGLKDRPHTLKVVKKSGAYMVLDKLLYTVAPDKGNWKDK